jgi:CDP-diacylglycerol--glycerol-3-phosphate 3-phosphatidyltransferase
MNLTSPPAIRRRPTEPDAMAADADTPPPVNAGPTGPSGDFRRLRESGEQSGASLAIGAGIGAARDWVARGLVFAGLTPNRLTVGGFLVTCAAGYCLVRGATDQVPYFYNGAGSTSWWPAWAGLFLLGAGACDMLDGAVARVGRMSSRFGAILDSTLDRFSDMAIFLGCTLHCARVGNFTGEVLAVIALCNAFLISYVKARAEEIIEDCSVGYWLRGERFVAVLLGCATGHVIAVLWLLAVLNLFTVWRRLDYARRAVASLERGLPPPSRGPSAGPLGRFQLWRHPRGSIPYDLVTGLNIAYLIVAPWVWPVLMGQGPSGDPLGAWLSG